MKRRIILKPFQEFLKSESAGGIILLCCVIASLLIANSPLGAPFEHLLQHELGWQTTGLHLRYSVLSWVNDGLMTIFFLLVGLEIKRELVAGELASPRKAALPIMAALGGVLAPALIYHLFNKGLPTHVGWGIPMATDIAFAIAVMTMLGKRVPMPLKIFLAALAIVDDLMAIIVVAVFYTRQLAWSNLLIAVGILALLITLNRFGVRKLVFYIVPGLVMWYVIHHSGIHATIAGVITAMTVPTQADTNGAPLEKLVHLLMKPVNFLIMPLFALVNTNIHFELSMLNGLFNPLGMGIILGLLLGKPIGITLISWLSVRCGICKLPAQSTWIHILGAGMLGGIGFTMSVFIAILSFTGQTFLLEEAKFFVLMASLLSGTVGSIFLTLVHKRQARSKARGFAYEE